MIKLKQLINQQINYFQDKQQLGKIFKKYTLNVMNKIKLQLVDTLQLINRYGIMNIKVVPFIRQYGSTGASLQIILSYNKSEKISDKIYNIMTLINNKTIYLNSVVTKNYIHIINV